MGEHSDALMRTHELSRMNDLWGDWGYDISYENSLWHAEHLADGAQWHAVSSQDLHQALFQHYAAMLPMPPAIPPIN